jgi:hypothetical protein
MDSVKQVTLNRKVIIDRKAAVVVINHKWKKDHLAFHQ